MSAFRAFAFLFVFVGCTRWGTTEVVGPPHEIGRRLVGSPQIEEVSQSGLDLGAHGSVRDGIASTSMTGGVSAGLSTVKRTHCVQPAEVDYTQSIDYTAHVEHRAGDLVPSLIIAGIGALVLVSTVTSDQDRYSDGMASSDTTTKYAVGGAMLAVGGAWAGYSLLALPGGAPPVPPTQEKRWTATQFVESTGCGLPGDQLTQGP